MSTEAQKKYNNSPEKESLAIDTVKKRDFIKSWDHCGLFIHPFFSLHCCGICRGSDPCDSRINATGGGPLWSWDETLLLVFSYIFCLIMQKFSLEKFFQKNINFTYVSCVKMCKYLVHSC
jgi:hypothetical protein